MPPIRNTNHVDTFTLSASGGSWALRVRCRRTALEAQWALEGSQGERDQRHIKDKFKFGKTVGTRKSSALSNLNVGHANAIWGAVYFHSLFPRVLTKPSEPLWTDGSGGRQSAEGVPQPVP